MVGGSGGDGTCSLIYNRCLSLIVVNAVGSIGVVFLYVNPKTTTTTTRKRAARDDDVTGGAQHSGKQLSHFESRSTVLAAAAEKEMSSERKPV